MPTYTVKTLHQEYKIERNSLEDAQSYAGSLGIGAEVSEDCKEVPGVAPLGPSGGQVNVSPDGNGAIGGKIITGNMKLPNTKKVQDWKKDNLKQLAVLLYDNQDYFELGGQALRLVDIRKAGTPSGLRAPVYPLQFSAFLGLIAKTWAGTLMGCLGLSRREAGWIEHTHWSGTDPSKIGVVKRLVYLICAGLPVDHKDQMTGRAALAYKNIDVDGAIRSFRC
jgi:hypothetical protein